MRVYNCNRIVTRENVYMYRQKIYITLLDIYKSRDRLIKRLGKYRTKNLEEDVSRISFLICKLDEKIDRVESFIKYVE